MQTPVNSRVVNIPVTSLMVGDRVVLTKGRHAIVKTIEFFAKGCRNVHVITSATSMVQCYDRVGCLDVLVTD